CTPIGTTSPYIVVHASGILCFLPCHKRHQVLSAGQDMMAVDSIRKPLLPSSVSTPKSILIKQQAGDKEAKGVSYHVSGMAKKVTFEIGVNEDNDSDGSIPWRKAGRRPPPQSTRRQRRPKRGDSSLSSQLAPPLNPSLGGTTRHLHKATGPSALFIKAMKQGPVCSGIKEEVGLQAALQQQKCWNLQPQHPQTQPSSQTGMKAEEAKGNLGKIEESRDGGNDPNAARGRAQARGAVNIGTRSMSLVDAMAGSRRALGGGGGGGFGGARSRGRRIWRLQEALNKAQSEEDQAVQGLHRDTTNSLVCVSTLPLPCPTSTTVPRAGMGISQSPSPDIVPPASSALPPPTPISRSGIMVKGGRPEGVVKGHDGDITDVTSSSPLRTPASVHGPSSPPNPAKGHHAARARGSQHRRNGGLSKSNTPQAASLVKALIPISPTESGPSQTALSLVSSASILESNMSHSMSLTPTMTSVLSVPRNNTSHDGLTPGTGHVVALDYAAALPGQSAESTIPYLPNCQPCTSEVSTSYLPEPFPDPSPNTILDGKTQTPCTLKAAMRDPEVPVALTREREDSIICHLPPPSGDFLSKTEPLGRSSPPPTLSFRDYAGGVATVGVPTTAGGIVSVIKLDALSGIGGSLEGARQGEEERTGKKDEAMLPAPCLPARHPYFPSPGLDFNCGSEGPDGNGKNNSEAVVREGRGGVPLGWGMRSSTRSARRRRQEDYVKNSKFVNAFASTTTSDVTTTSSENVNLKSASPGGEQEENRGSREGEMGSTAGTLEAVTLRPSCAATAIDSTRTDSGLSISVSSSPPSGRQYVIAAEELTDGSSCVSTLTTKPGRRLKRKKLEEGRTSPITRSPRHHPQGPRRQGLRRSRRSNNGGQSRTLASSHEEACADASPSAPANEGKAEIREESASSPNPASAQEGKDADDSAQDNKVFDLNDTYDSEEVLDCDGADDPSAAAGFTAEAVTETTAAPALGDLPEASIDTSIDDTLEAASVPPTNIHEAMVAAETATTNAETPVAAPMGEGDGAVLYQVAVPVIEPVQPLYTRIRLVLGVLFQFGKGRDQDTKEDVNLDGDVEGSQSEAKVGESAITELSPTPHRKGNPSGRSLGRGRGWG
ncbi:unnamed protein product, partial [Choristocarpus tenellus]